MSDAKQDRPYEAIPSRASYEGTGGWKDGRLGQAYDLIYAALKDGGVDPSGHALLASVEQEDGSVLPDGLRYHDGEVQFECRSCGKWSEWPSDVADFEPGAYENMCGGSPRCCP